MVVGGGGGGGGGGGVGETCANFLPLQRYVQTVLALEFAQLLRPASVTQGSPDQPVKMVSAM